MQEGHKFFFMLHYINHNGTLIKSDKPFLTVDNRAFRYGDALFETMRMSQGNVLFLENHLQRLKDGMHYLKMKIPTHFSPLYFRNLLRELTEKNTLFNARIRLQVYRNDGGLYTPATHATSFVIQMEPVQDTHYVLNTEGLNIALYEEIAKPICKLSNLKTTNSIYSVLAGIYKKEHHLDDCLLLNSEGNIAEAVSSNIFMVRENIFYTPSLNSGCVAGIMRDQLIKILRKNKKKIHETTFPPDDLLSADEIFLTNVVSGIRWVKRYKGKIYSNKMTQWLMGNLNKKNYF